MVPCALCGIQYDASARTYRDIQAGRVEARCVLHRKRKPRAATVTAAARRWWLDRYTIEEIAEIGAAVDDWFQSLRPSTREAAAPRPLLASAAPRIDMSGDVEGEEYGVDLNAA